MYGPTQSCSSWMRAGKPTVVAGVPPDYFSPTGQLWGNPLYRWEVHTASGYAWWLARINAVLQMVDIIRIDHFRGFAGYYEVPGDALNRRTRSLGAGTWKRFLHHSVARPWATCPSWQKIWV